MDFSLTDDQRLIRDTVRHFMDAEVRPSIRARDREENLSRGPPLSGIVPPQKTHRESDLTCQVEGNTQALSLSFWRGPAPPLHPPSRLCHTRHYKSPTIDLISPASIRSSHQPLT